MVGGANTGEVVLSQIRMLAVYETGTNIVSSIPLQALLNSLPLCSCFGFLPWLLLMMSYILQVEINAFLPKVVFCLFGAFCLLVRCCSVVMVVFFTIIQSKLGQQVKYLLGKMTVSLEIYLSLSCANKD